MTPDEATILDALTSLALSDAAMETATAELLAKDATIIELRAMIATDDTELQEKDATIGYLTAEADMAEREWQAESDARNKDFADYSATIIDLRAKLAREFERGFLQGRNVATPVQQGACRVPGCDCGGLLYV